jgi:hypothetical protein
VYKLMMQSGEDFLRDGRLRRSRLLQKGLHLAHNLLNTGGVASRSACEAKLEE